MHVYDNYDVAVIGAGHAGIEAALAAARLGAKTIIFTLSLDAIGNLPCNPSIGGTAKGHLVREIDALGGEIGLAADHTALQCRMLNLAKGPAVHSLRFQSDRRAYQAYMKSRLESQPNLSLMQDEVTEILCEKGCVSGVRTRLDAVYPCTCAIIATGTYLGGRIYIGEASWVSGPDSITASTELTASLAHLGLPLRRFKTGTPARALRQSIDFSNLREQRGDETTCPFSFMNDSGPQNTVVCHIAYTNEKTHGIIRENIHRAPMYNGTIHSVGPRYCPSIEDKVMRFPDKVRHQTFIEPCGGNTDEMYLQGLSSSLPLDVQMQVYRSIEGFEHIQLMRAAYAIEYDCIDPLALRPTMEVRDLPGLFASGQFNGTSGYEEAAAQGLVAGVNAVRKIRGQAPFILTRQDSYIGVLIDDLVTKGVDEPYRMMTSRSEYRLALRQDNADLRLCEKGRQIGLVSDERYERFLSIRSQVETALTRVRQTGISPGDAVNEMLARRHEEPIHSGTTVEMLLKRPGVGIQDISGFCDLAQMSDQILKRVEIEIKYEGYIRRQQIAIEHSRRMEDTLLPEEMDYRDVVGLRIEARDRLNTMQPLSLGQAGRISGVNPADIAVLEIYLKKKRSEERSGNH